jgi:hypothetical protein
MLQIVVDNYLQGRTVGDNLSNWGGVDGAVGGRNNADDVLHPFLESVNTQVLAAIC